MKFIQGQDRNQTTLFPVSLEQAIDPDNEVRIIDLFVDSLPLKDYGFKVDYQENGRPAYRPEDLLKLFIYGYLNKVRSMRDLEKEQRWPKAIVDIHTKNIKYLLNTFIFGKFANKHKER